MWSRIYAAKTLAEASIVRDTLVAGGVDARVRGEQRAGIAGEIPLPDAMAEVIVPGDQLLLARSLLAAVEESRPAWACSRCGEENPGSFEVCWKCASG